MSWAALSQLAVMGVARPAGPGTPAEPLARIDSQTEIGLGGDRSPRPSCKWPKWRRFGYVGKRALIEVAGLSNLEQRLTAIEPDFRSGGTRASLTSSPSRRLVS